MPIAVGALAAVILTALPLQSSLAQQAQGRGRRGADTAAARRGAPQTPATAPGLQTGVQPSTQSALQGAPSGSARQVVRPTRDTSRQEPPVITRHSMTLNGQALRYTATTGMMPIRNRGTEETEGQIFYVYYQKEPAGDPSTRPITFVFNGGPGSATVWLHMGAYGPKKVKLLPNGDAGPPPYSLEENPNTLLDQTDLVFLDPVGTGYSRATSSENGPRFWGLDEDAQSVTEFIRLFLTRNQRWGSPKFLSGESYGTTRAAHLAGMLADNGIALNGIAFISMVWSFPAQSPTAANDIGYVNFIPSYATTAWYHHKLPADLQAKSVDDVAKEAERFALGEYSAALNRGATLTPTERAAIVEKIARYTGLPASIVEDNDLRIDLNHFSQALLHDKRRMTGRLDSRFSIWNQDPAAERPSFDISEASIRNTFTPVLNEYVRRELGYDTDRLYYILGGGIGAWRWPDGDRNVMPSLERGLNKNPYLRVFLAEGYYDMATPFGAAQYSIDHLNVDPALRAQFDIKRYPAGHMIYIDAGAMKQMREDLRRWMASAIAAPAMPVTGR
jgi:carboxypeptidase C (cathepsin A)